MKKNITKLVFGFVAFIYITFIILNLIDKTNDIPHALGIDDDSIAVKLDIAPQIEPVSITSLSGPSVGVIHVNPNNHDQLISNGYQSTYVSLDHGVTWSKIALHEYIEFAVWIDNTILVALKGDSKTFMLSQDFGVSWNSVTIHTDSDEQIIAPEFSENFEVSWKPIPISSLDKETLFYLRLNLNQQGNPVVQFAEDVQYHFELNDHILYIKKEYKATDAQSSIYLDDIRFAHGKIPAVVSVSDDGLWAATRGGVFFKKQDGTEWKDASASFGAHSFNRSFESHRGDKLLLLDAIGRLIMSDDKGKSWRSLASNVSKAAFLKDESVVAIQQSGRVIHIDGGKNFELISDWKLIDNKITSSRYRNQIYFIHGGKDNIWLTVGPPNYLPEKPIEIGHHNAITKYLGSAVYDVVAYHYNRKEKRWMAKPWSADFKNESAVEDRCELRLDYDNVVTINRHKTSKYGTAKKVMLIQSGNAYAHFNDDEVHIRTLKNCKPQGVKKVWDFGAIVSPAAYYETDEGLEIVALGYRSNTIERIKIDVSDTPPLWRWFFYFFYYRYGVYIIGLGLVLWFIYIRRKSAKKQEP